MALKRCSKCKKTKPEEQFGWRHKGERQTQCRACRAAIKRAWMAKKRAREGKAFYEDQRIYNALWRRSKGAKAVPQRAGKRKRLSLAEQSEFLPIEPLREYLTKRLVHYASVNDMAEAMGIPERSIRRFFEPQTRHVQIDTVDRMLITEGFAMLEELYPLDSFKAA